MLNSLVLAAIVLQAATVDVGRARVSFVTSEARLQEICGVDGKLVACTLFAGYRLDATCSTQGTVWKINASARFLPLVYLFQAKAMAHESIHIDDLRRSAEQYLVELSQMDFPSAEVCQEAAGLARSGFKDRMQQFARDSHAKWHPRSNLLFRFMTNPVQP